jgi:hypothetical protein
MPVIGTLVIDLEANTATFTGDLGNASQAVENFGASASEAGEQIDFSMREAKGSMMLLGEEVGVHIPRHLQTLIAEIPGVGVAFAEMLPLVGVIAAIALITKFIEKNDEAKTKMDNVWSSIAQSGEQSMDRLKLKTMEVEEQTQKLAGNYLGALITQLKIINAEKLDAVAHEFDELGKKALATFEELKVGWVKSQLLGMGHNEMIDDLSNRFTALIAKVNEYKAAGDGSNLLKTLEGEKTRLEGVVASMQGLGSSMKPVLEANAHVLSLINQEIAAYKERDKAAQGEAKNDKTEEVQREAAAQNALFEAQQRGLEQRRSAEARYAKEVLDLRKKATEEQVKMAEAEAKATQGVLERAEEVQRGLMEEGLKQEFALAKLRESAEEQHDQHLLAMRQATAQETVEAEVKAAQERARVESDDLSRQIAYLSQFGHQYEVKLKELEDKKLQIVMQSANQITKIRQQAEEKQYQDINRAETQMADAVAKNVTKSILESKNMGLAFEKMGAQMLEAAMENFLKMALLGDMKQAKDAAHAASSAYSWVMQEVPFPANAALAPAAAAAAFAGVMAFEEGGEIPGEGAVPIIGHGGETVVTKALTDQVKNNAGGGSGHNFHFAPRVSAIDRDGVDKMLRQHEHVFAARMTAILRKNHKRG